MNTICNAVKLPAFSTSPALGDTLQMVRKLVTSALLSALEARLGFPTEPWLEGIGHVWLNRFVAAAKALPRQFISFNR